MGSLYVYDSCKTKNNSSMLLVSNVKNNSLQRILFIFTDAWYTHKIDVDTVGKKMIRSNLSSKLFFIIFNCQDLNQGEI